MHIPIYQVDAFSEKPFAGNPAAICLLTEDISPEKKLQIAAENNLSETAFLLPIDENHFHLQWFTPATEVKLCGHATLASAHILWQTGHVPLGKTIYFETLSGTLIVHKQDTWITMDFPAVPAVNAEIPEVLKDYFGENAVHIQLTAGGKYIVELPNEAAVRNFTPDFQAIKDYLVLITAKGEGQYDFVSRLFAVPVGISEDPVTGSAHCALAPYWSERLHKNDFLAYQASARGGEMKVSLQGDRVLLSGKAVTVLSGEFYL